MVRGCIFSNVSSGSRFTRRVYFRWGGNGGRKRGRKEKKAETKRGITATQAHFKGGLVTLLARARALSWLVCLCPPAPRGKKDRAFESFFVKEWTAFPERTYKFLCFLRDPEIIQKETPFFDPIEDSCRDSKLHAQDR